MSERPGSEPMLTVDEAASGAGVASAQIRVWVSEGTLPVLRTALRRLRFRASDIAALVNESGACENPMLTRNRLAAASVRAADREVRVKRYLDTGAFGAAALTLLFVADRFASRTTQRVLQHGVIGPVGAVAVYLVASVLLGTVIAVLLRQLVVVREARPRPPRPDDSRAAEGTATSTCTPEPSTVAPADDAR